jgi:hypothetical protein
VGIGTQLTIVLLYVHIQYGTCYSRMLGPPSLILVACFNRNSVLKGGNEQTHKHDCFLV